MEPPTTEIEAIKSQRELGLYLGHGPQVKYPCMALSSISPQSRKKRADWQVIFTGLCASEAGNQ